MNNNIAPNRIYKDFDLSFNKLPTSGDVARKFDVNAVKQSLKNLIMTQHYERLFHPEIGSPIRGLLFEPIDAVTTNAIKQGIERLIQNHEPRVRLVKLEVTPSEDENSYEISIHFFIVGIGTPVTFSTILTRLR